MKNSIKILTLLFTFLIFTSLSFANSDINVTINGVEVIFPDAKPFIDAEAGRTMIPVRFIAEDLKSEVKWNAEDRIVYINKGDNNIQLTIDSNIAIVNNESVKLDTEAIIHEDRTYVPLRFVIEQLGAEVDWDGSTRTVIIKEEPMIITNPDFTPSENNIQNLPQGSPKQTIDGLPIYYFNENGEYDDNGIGYVSLGSIFQKYRNLQIQPNLQGGEDLYTKNGILIIENLPQKLLNLEYRVTYDYYKSTLYPKLQN
jgi:hypothetical protein